MTKSDQNNLTGKQMAAIFLIKLGPERAAQIMQKLQDTEIKQLSQEISKWEKVPAQVTDKTLKEFHRLSLARQYITQGGKEYAKEVLERALDDHKAIDIMDNLGKGSESNLLSLLENVDLQQLLNFLRSEHPQTIALILSYLKSEQAAIVLQALPKELQGEVTMRIINIGQISPGIVKKIERVLTRELSHLSDEAKLRVVGGTRAAAEILNRVDRATEKEILDRLEKKNLSLAEEVKKLMFVFEDILVLDDRAIQRVLREVDTKDLSLALKGASKDLKEKFFKNMSSRAQETIKEDMELMGPVRVRQVEEVQQKIVDTTRRLEEAGEIVGRAEKEEEIIV